ncbi:DUF998 domain-containing protein [Sphaerisporangium flaviroseum]|uniref:DUF998 domain-containing protein n=1 Tax=Sphaerisporangium flaviroseum TaxID=509199 RepID=A0ABP7HL14_9ACTN
MGLKIRLLLGCGVIAGPLFMVVLLVTGALRDGYDPIRHAGSTLALGDSGWTQVVNFLVTGLLTVAFAAGLWLARGGLGGSFWGPLLVGVWGVGLLGAGVFVTDPVAGYPPGTPLLTDPPTTAGSLHDLLSLAGFVGLAAACFVFTRRFAVRREIGWAVYSALTGIGFLAGIVLSTRAFADTGAGGLAGTGGLFQRLAIGIGFTWLTLLAVRTLRTPEVCRSTS